MHDPREAALVGVRSTRIVAGVDGHAATKQRVGESRPAVVLQRPQLKGCGADELIAGFQRKIAARRANQVVAIGHKKTKFAIVEVNRPEVRRDNRTFEFHRTP